MTKTYATLGFNDLLEVRKTGRCPVCHDNVDPRGVGGHVRGAKHVAMAERARLVARSLTVTRTKFERVLREAGVECEAGPSQWLEDTRLPIRHGQVKKPSGRVERSLYVASAVAAFLQEHETSLVQDSVMLRPLATLGKLKPKARERWLRSAAVAIGLGAQPAAVFGELMFGEYARVVARVQQPRKENTP